LENSLSLTKKISLVPITGYLLFIFGAGKSAEGHLGLAEITRPTIGK